MLGSTEVSATIPETEPERAYPENGVKREDGVRIVGGDGKTQIHTSDGFLILFVCLFYGFLADRRSEFEVMCTNRSYHWLRADTPE